jgi:hypothetical protein
MPGNPASIRRHRAAHRTPRHRSRTGLRLAARATAGAVISVILVHWAMGVLWHGHEPSLLHWSTALAAAGGAAVAGAGRKGLNVSVPLVALSAAAIGSIAVFDHHREENQNLHLVFELEVADPRIPIPTLGSVDATVSQPSPSPRGCGRSRVTVDYSLFMPPSRSLTITSAQPAVLLRIEHPHQSKVIAPSGSGSPSQPGLHVLRTGLTQFGDERTVLQTTLKEGWRHTLGAQRRINVFLAFEIDELAQPRSVGSCYVPLPFLGVAAAHRYGRVELEPSSGTILADFTHPAPTLAEFPNAVSSGAQLWQCDDKPQLRKRIYEECAAVVVIEAEWRGVFEALALVVIGALISLAMEYVVALLRARQGAGRA